MKSDASSPDPTITLLLIIAGAVAIYGLLNNLLFVGGAVVVAGAALARHKRYRTHGFVAAALGIVFFAVVFAYGIGKDMALRDNALDAPAASAPSTAG